MPGARPSSFKQSGGYLNNVDVKLVDYEFTTEFPGGDGGKRKGKKNDEFTPLYCVLDVLVDGADENSQTTLFVGNADNFEIENDGKTLVPVDESYGLGANFDFSRLIDSLVKNGFPETNLPEDEINYEAILNWRVRLKQERDEELTKRLGKKKSKDGKKEYDRTYLVVTQVYGPADGSAKSASSGKATTGKAVAGKAGKASEADRLNTLAKDTLLSILEDNDGKIMKSKLPIQIAKKLGTKNPDREEVRKIIYSDEFLGTEDGWTFDASSKNQTIETA